MAKKAGVLGSGSVGRVLAAGLIKHGYEVMVGTRNTEKLEEWLSGEGKGARAGSFQETAEFGDLIVLAVKGSVAEGVLEIAGRENLDGKIIIDATNPIADLPPDNGVLRFFTGLERSLMERLQETFPHGRFVKSFNSVGNAHMVNPDFPDGKPSMFICGNDQAAKTDVESLLDDFGWIAEDLGPVEAARAIEPLCILWCIPGFNNNTWNHAFKVIRR